MVNIPPVKAAGKACVSMGPDIEAANADPELHTHIMGVTALISLMQEIGTCWGEKHETEMWSSYELLIISNMQSSEEKE